MVSTGFFLGDTTFFKDIKVLKPGASFVDGKIKEPEWNGIILQEIYLSQTL